MFKILLMIIVIPKATMYKVSMQLPHVYLGKRLFSGVDNVKPKPLILLKPYGTVTIAAPTEMVYWNDTKSVELGNIPVKFSPTVVDAINSWGKGAEIEWFLSDEAGHYMEKNDVLFNHVRSQLAPALGLDSFENHNMRRHDFDSNRPRCLLVDDSYYPLFGMGWWRESDHAICLRPSAILGLTAQHIKEVNDFLDKFSSYEYKRIVKPFNQRNV